MTTIECDAKTHARKIRGHNEDSIFASVGDCLWIIADDMGGDVATEHALSCCLGRC